MALQRFRAFIFDMDGTLVDSKLDFDAMRADLGFPVGVPILEHIDSLEDSISLEERNRYFEIIHRHENEGANQSVMMEGCHDFLEFLHLQGIKTAVLTRNSRVVTDITFKKWDLSFEVVLSRDCIVKQKPHPEGLHLICESLGVSPEEAVYMGDYLFDLEAAKNAGMKGILFSPERNPEFEKEADYVVRSYLELQKNFSSDFLRSLNFTL